MFPEKGHDIYQVVVVDYDGDQKSSDGDDDGEDDGDDKVKEMDGRTSRE